MDFMELVLHEKVALDRTDPWGHPGSLSLLPFQPLTWLFPSGMTFLFAISFLNPSL